MTCFPPNKRVAYPCLVVNQVSKRVSVPDPDRACRKDDSWAVSLRALLHTRANTDLYKIHDDFPRLTGTTGNFTAYKQNSEFRYRGVGVRTSQPVDHPRDSAVARIIL